MSTVQRHDLITFGSFEVDLHTGEIRKYGMRVRLQSQPFRVLLALLAKPGEVVTREELQRQIWGEHTTVDFERGIATAISKLREALGDSADHPRYVETLAKRGFRFIAPVIVEPPHEAPLPALPEKPPSPAPPAVPEVEQAVVLPARIPTAIPGVSLPVASSETVQPRLASVPWQRFGYLACAAVGLVCLSSLVTLKLTRPVEPLQASRILQLTQASEIYDGPPNPENLLTLVTDGPRVYTSFLTGGRPEIGSVDSSGTAREAIAMPNELSSAAITDISRNGSRLIVRERRSRDSEQPLWIVRRDDSSALRVGDVLAHDATFMPDGESLLYANGNELDTVQLKSGAIARYAALPGRAFWLRWSPSNSVLRFTLIDPVTHNSSLWELEPSTRHIHPLPFAVSSSRSLCCGSWSASGNVYVFQASDGHGSDLWAVKAGAHQQVTRLTNGPLSYISPLPSRTEDAVYFVGLEPPAGTRFFDRNLRKFVPAPSFLQRARRVTYSRDGRWVAWVDVDGRLWRALSGDGSERLQLTPDDLDVFLAQWSPDQSQLVMMAREPGQTWQVYTVDARGGLVRKVLADQRNLADPDWSADGTKLVFGREADLMGKETGARDIHVLDLKTMQSVLLPGSENLFSPRWSPDGQWIAALSTDQTRLLLYDVAHRTWKTLVEGSAADPVWGLDSKTVYFHAFTDPRSAILKVSVLGGPAVAVADLLNLDSPKADSYFFGGVTPAGAPIIEPRIGTGNLYSIRLPE